MTSSNETNDAMSTMSQVTNTISDSVAVAIVEHSKLHKKRRMAVTLIKNYTRSDEVPNGEFLI